MLVLTRKKNETILIGDNITLTVVSTGLSVRLGIDAPRRACGGGGHNDRTTFTFLDTKGKP